MANYKVEKLTGQMLLFGLLGKLLYMSPDKEWIQHLLDDDVFSEVPFGEDQEDVVQGLNYIQDWISTNLSKNPASAIASLEEDYLRLFIGAGKVLAPPWESVYFTDDRSMFSEETLQVRNCYRKYGLQIEHLYHEPDDHIGLELSFLAHLAQLAVQALEQEGSAELIQLLHDQQAFLTEHPLRWSTTWCELVLQHARTDFYRGIALLINGALKASDEFITEALSQLPQEI
ncbi:MAG TPA: molecular chaperone TorD family protein [Bellilinea sp.]|nr:molecular chaperone TorD family protein [Bellilinea sp.]